MADAVKIFNRSTGKMTSEEFCTAEEAEKKYFEYIKNLNSHAYKGEEYIVTRFNEGRCMCAEVIVGIR